jgi:hypothetical protein
MNKDSGPLTEEERAELGPAFERLEATYHQLDAAFARAGRRPPVDDTGDVGGYCGICNCSSFQGNGAS